MYTLELVTTPERAAGGKVTRKVKVGEKGTAPIEEKIELGYVEAGPNKLIELGGQKVRRVAFEVGPRKVIVVGTPGHDDPAHPANVVVKAGATVIAN